MVEKITDLAKRLLPYMINQAASLIAIYGSKVVLYRPAGTPLYYPNDATGLLAALAAATGGCTVWAVGLGDVNQAITIPADVTLIGYGTRMTKTVSLSEGSVIEGLVVDIEDDYTTVIALAGPTSGTAVAMGCHLRAILTTVGQAKAAFGRPDGTLRLISCLLEAKQGGEEGFDLNPITQGGAKEVQVVSFAVQANNASITTTPFAVLTGFAYLVEARNSYNVSGSAKQDAQWRSALGDFSDGARSDNVIFAGLNPAQPVASDPTYTATHIYTFDMTGTTGTIGARVYDQDGNYADNSGNTNVEMWLKNSVVQVQGCTFLTGTLSTGWTGIPLWGDRSAWDASEYPARHANDVNAGDTAIHHTIGSGYGQVASGGHSHDDPNQWGLIVPKLEDNDSSWEAIYWSLDQNGLVYSDEDGYVHLFAMLDRAQTFSELQTFTTGIETPRSMLTPEGGYAVRYTNRTGATSIKGSIVRASTGYDDAVEIAPASSDEAIGVVYENGVADGSDVWVVVSGRVQVLLKDGTVATRGYWVQVSDTAGRVDATNANPLGPPDHFGEIGHCLESRTSGTDVLCWVNLHFN